MKKIEAENRALSGIFLRHLNKHNDAFDIFDIC